ncbi:hypothetical protein P154DRAFT_130860 [Amniculicola lignicola CBS 123094]|uniref:Uncharacterized protein n=1 Tax=Amniculicola lignicola CBS 123094 TaxID=1392246 RepID=A0A6A5WL85_9PLEO|nr:hypothetical protein P154DRAFT_130860 [Amniculicola lignicola CBS 123094]
MADFLTQNLFLNLDQDISVDMPQGSSANDVANVKEHTENNPKSATNTAEAFENTEMIVPSFKDPVLPPFPHHQYPSFGSNILLLTPTQNKFKTKLLRETFENQIPKGQILHTLCIAFDSGVGEQPYNEAGLQGAWNRISNALHYLDKPENQTILKEEKIGTVIVASIENYIQITDVERPTDYGVIVIHNTTTDKTVATLSQGVTVPIKYLDRARKLGFEDEEKNFGKVTVGVLFAEEVEGIDKANWHEVVAGKSRYDILTEAVSKIDIPWS